jgi:general stress protein 26
VKTRPTHDPVALRKVFADVPVARLASVDPDGSPHVVPLWFVWREEGMYLSLRRDSRTWANLERDDRVAVVMDVGRTWTELAGVELSGHAELLVPGHPALRNAMSAWHQKYLGLFPGRQWERLAADLDRLGFVRLTPERLAAWDHALRR